MRPHIQCQALHSPENGTINIHGHSHGLVAEYECDAGYVLTGDRTRECTPFNTKWSGNEPSSCHGIFLSLSLPPPPPPPPPNIIIYPLILYSKDIKLEFYISAAVDCGIPCSIADGDVIFISTIFGSMANYTCKSGCFNVSRVCTENGTWSGSLPVCTSKNQII